MTVPDGRAAFTTGSGRCPLVLGECLQGRLPNGRHFLITAPIPLHSTAEFVPDPELGCVVPDPAGKTKAVQAVGAWLAANALPPGGRLRVSTPLDPGQGFGTSTADIAASVRAAAAAWRRSVAPKEIARIAVAVEPSDGSMFPGCVAFAHREGVLLEALATLPRFRALVACTGGTVDTVAYDELRQDFRYPRKAQRALLDAWDMVRTANRTGDVALLGRATTISARISQQFLPKPFFEELLGFAAIADIDGIITAHSGTVQALVFDPTRPGFERRLEEGRRFLAGLPLASWFELSNLDVCPDRQPVEVRGPASVRGRRDPGPAVRRRADSLLDLIRDVYLLAVPPRAAARPGARLWVQYELGLPGGMKDRVALHMIEDAEARGDLRPGGTIVESSSGSMAEGLARVGLLKGYRVLIVTDPRIDELTLAKLRALGAEVEVVDTYDPDGGWQTVRLRRLHRLLERIHGAYWPSQYDSPNNPDAYASVGDAIVDELGSGIAAVVGTVGSGGSLCGLARAIRRRLPGVRVVAVDGVGSVLFNQPLRVRLQSGHGNGLIPGNVDYQVIDEVHWVSDGEAFNACRELACASGIFGGGSSGAAHLVASWVAQGYHPDRHVVAVFPDRGDRYAATIYSDQFMAERGLVGQVAGPEPVRIRYGLDVAERWSVAELPHDGAVPYHAPDAVTTGALARNLAAEGAAR